MPAIPQYRENHASAPARRAACAAAARPPGPLSYMSAAVLSPASLQRGAPARLRVQEPRAVTFELFALPEIGGPKRPPHPPPPGRACDTPYEAGARPVRACSHPRTPQTPVPCGAGPPLCNTTTPVRTGDPSPLPCGDPPLAAQLTDGADAVGMLYVIKLAAASAPAQQPTTGPCSRGMTRCPECHHHSSQGPLTRAAPPARMGQQGAARRARQQARPAAGRREARGESARRKGPALSHQSSISLTDGPRGWAVRAPRAPLGARGGARVGLPSTHA
ncbi:MAG: hypothetical protein J3K34DRAFT_57144 [Monoraphidium minutum]|nr:MAG: hypothetical protein J3K34DRAFT_57144 [Monoraphidium minutum]